MWIRSQDKMMLGNFEVLNINYENKTEILGWSNHVQEDNADSSMILGKYGTKERAIEVLDDIHFTLTDGYSLATKTINGTLQSCVVYVMPDK